MARFILVLPVLAAFVATAQQQAKIEAGAEEQLISKVENAIRGAEPEWHYTRSILNAPPPIVPSERVLVAGVCTDSYDNCAFAEVKFKALTVPELNQVPLIANVEPSNPPSLCHLSVTDFAQGHLGIRARIDSKKI